MVLEMESKLERRRSKNSTPWQIAS